MTEPDAPTPEEEGRLRRLLAQAHETGPTPPEVVARLDETLADLEADRAPREGTVVPLERRRRRAVAGMVAAAAAVVVAGVGVTQVVLSGSDEHPTAGDAAVVSEADGEAARDAEAETFNDDQDAAEEAAPEAGSAKDSAAERPEPTDIEMRAVDEPAPTLRTDRLERDARRIRRDLPDDAATYWHGTGALLLTPADFECSEGGWGRGVLVGVRYDARAAVVAFREPATQHQVVEVMQCGTGETLRSVTLPAPSE